MAYYSIFLNLSGRRCIVIGGGSVGERKVEGLLQSGAAVKVVSPRLTARLEALVSREEIQHVSREYRAGDLRGCDLAFVATDDGALNARVYQEARKQRVWINAADDPNHCDFILPSLIRRGELTVAVSTGGASPAAARAIREELEEYFTDDFGEVAAIASEVRRELSQQSAQVSASSWREALTGDFRRLIREGNPRDAKKLLLEKLGVTS